MMSELVTVRELAKELGIDRCTVSNRISNLGIVTSYINKYNNMRKQKYKNTAINERDVEKIKNYEKAHQDKEIRVICDNGIFAKRWSDYKPKNDSLCIYSYIDKQLMELI